MERPPKRRTRVGCAGAVLDCKAHRATLYNYFPRPQEGKHALHLREAGSERPRSGSSDASRRSSIGTTQAVPVPPLQPPPVLSAAQQGHLRQIMHDRERQVHQHVQHERVAATRSTGGGSEHGFEHVARESNRAPSPSMQQLQVRQLKGRESHIYQYYYCLCLELWYKCCSTNHKGNLSNT